MALQVPLAPRGRLGHRVSLEPWVTLEPQGPWEPRVLQALVGQSVQQEPLDPGVTTEPQDNQDRMDLQETQEHQVYRGPRGPLEHRELLEIMELTEPRVPQEPQDPWVQQGAQV